MKPSLARELGTRHEEASLLEFRLESVTRGIAAASSEFKANPLKSSLLYKKPPTENKTLGAPKVSKLITAIVFWIVVSLVMGPLVAFALSMWQALGQLGCTSMAQVQSLGLDAEFHLLYWAHFWTYLPLTVVLCLVLIPLVYLFYRCQGRLS